MMKSDPSNPSAFQEQAEWISNIVNSSSFLLRQFENSTLNQSGLKKQLEQFVVHPAEKLLQNFRKQFPENQSNDGSLDTHSGLRTLDQGFSVACNPIAMVDAWLNIELIWQKWESWEKEYVAIVPQTLQPTEAKELENTLRRYCEEFERIPGKKPRSSVSPLYDCLQNLFSAYLQTVVEFNKYSINPDEHKALRRIHDGVKHVQCDWKRANRDSCVDVPNELHQFMRQSPDLRSELPGLLDSLKSRNEPFPEMFDFGVDERMVIIGNAVDQAKLLLFDVLLSYFDRQSIYPSVVPSWLSRLEAFINKLWCDPEWHCRLERDGEFVDYDDALRISSLRQTGLSLIPTSSSNEPVCLRRSLQYRPSNVLKIRLALIELQKAVQGRFLHFSSLCQTLANQLKDAKSLNEWLEAPETTGLLLEVPSRAARVWEIVQYCRIATLTSDLSTIALEAICEVREAFKVCDVNIDEITLEEQKTGVPFWIVSEVPPDKPAKRSDERIELHSQTGWQVSFPKTNLPVFPPAALAIQVRPDSHGLNVWETVTSILHELKRRDPKDKIWISIDANQLGSIVDKSSSGEMVAETLNVFLKYTRSGKDGVCVSLAKRCMLEIIRSASNEGIELLPKVDLSTGKGLDAIQQPSHRVECVWCKSDVSPNTAIEIIRFATKNELGSVKMSGGPNLDEFLVEFFELRFFPEPLPDILKQLQIIRTNLATKERDSKNLKKMLTGEMLKWVEGLKNEDTPNALALNEWLDGLSKGQLPGDEWYRWLRNRCQFKTCPELVQPKKPGGPYTICWQPEMKVEDYEKIQWEISEKLVGHAIDNVFFGLNSKQARGTFSLGNPFPGQPLRLVYELIQVAKKFPSKSKLQEHLFDAAESLRRMQLPFEKQLQINGFVGEVRENVQVCLNDLQDSVDPAQLKEDAFRLVVQLAEIVQVRILPANWSFLSSEIYPDITAYVFDDSVKLGFRRISFGVEVDGQGVKPASIQQSVGPAPNGWNELNLAVEKLPTSSRTALLTNLKTWPKAFNESRLPSKLMMFISEWFDTERKDLVKTHLDQVKLVEEALVQIAKELKCKFFRPAIDDLADDLNRFEIVHNDHTTKVRGNYSRVRRVLRPGLLSSENIVLLKAKVEIVESQS